MNPEHIRAAIRLLYPDEMTPTAKRVLEKILDQEDHEAVADAAASSNEDSCCCGGMGCGL